jgi:hypothetical protein
LLVTAVAATKTSFAVTTAKLGTAARRRTATAFATATAAGIAARGAAFTGLATEAALGLDAFVPGEFFKAVGLGFSLRPRGLEEIFQVEVEFGTGAH